MSILVSSIRRLLKCPICWSMLSISYSESVIYCSCEVLCDRICWLANNNWAYFSSSFYSFYLSSLFSFSEA